MDAGRLFQRKIEDFECLFCGRFVVGNGYTNHCPHCLTSRHVDVNPGDRASECGGVMDPVGAKKDGKKGFMILQRCRGCGHERWNRASPDDDVTEIAGLLSSGPAIE